MRALAALAALSFATVACTGSTEDEATEVEETSQDLVSRSAYFETFEGIDGQYYFNVMAGNGQKVLRSEGYQTMAGATNGIEAILANGSDARHFEVHEASNGDHYFNVTAANGEIVGTSELYSRKTSADRGARVVRALVRLAREEETKKRLAPCAERFELFTGEDSATYFRLRAGNGEIMLASQGYDQADGAKAGIASVQANGADASHFEVFEAADGGWAVRLRAGNGETVARGEVYASKGNAMRAVTRLAEILAQRVPVAAAK